MKFKARPDIENKDPVIVDSDVCDLCGACVGLCPPDCITMTKDKLTIIGDDCIKCGFCIIICPIEALSWNDPIKAKMESVHD